MSKKSAKKPQVCTMGKGCERGVEIAAGQTHLFRLGDRRTRGCSCWNDPSAEGDMQFHRQLPRVEKPERGLKFRLPQVMPWETKNALARLYQTLPQHIPA